jgi:hypothetical protein
MEVGDAISEYQLRIILTGNETSISELLSGDQITVHILDKENIEKIPDLQKTTFKKGNIISFPISITEKASGNLILEIELLSAGKTFAMLKTFVPEASECPVIRDTGEKNIQIQPNATGSVKKDYRERFIYGDITIDETAWPDFMLIIKAEKSIGGGVEKIYIKTREPGTYSYRLGNLYQGEYIFEVTNLETDVNATKVNFGPEDISRKIDIHIPRIAPVNFRLYNPEIVNIIPRQDGTYSYNLKAYVCRFDDSKVKNLYINWSCAGIYYYNTHAPERGRCMPLYPAPVTLKHNEQIKIEMQINPLVMKNDSGSTDNILLETDWSDNDAEISLSGGK